MLRTLIVVATALALTSCATSTTEADQTRNEPNDQFAMPSACLGCAQAPMPPQPLPAGSSARLVSLGVPVRGGITTDVEHSACDGYRSANTSGGKSVTGAFFEDPDPRAILLLPLFVLMDAGRGVANAVKGGAAAQDCESRKAAEAQEAIKQSLPVLWAHPLLDEVRIEAEATGIGGLKSPGAPLGRDPEVQRNGNPARAFSIQVGATRIQFVQREANLYDFWIWFFAEGRLVDPVTGKPVHSVIAVARSEHSHVMNFWKTSIVRAADNDSDSVESEWDTARRKIARMLVDDWMRPALSQSSRR